MGATYSFLSVNCSMIGPGGVANFGQGAAPSEEGITFEPVEDANAMTIAADGNGMHSLHATKAGTVTIRLLKTSPVNKILSQMFAFQTSAPSLHGQNTITLSDTNSGDAINCQQVAFKRQATLTYGKDGGMNEWQFDAVKMYSALGAF